MQRDPSREPTSSCRGTLRAKLTVLPRPSPLPMLQTWCAAVQNWLRKLRSALTSPPEQPPAEEFKVAEGAAPRQALMPAEIGRNT
jgi:hypothetical protein